MDNLALLKTASEREFNKKIVLKINTLFFIKSLFISCFFVLISWVLGRSSKSSCLIGIKKASFGSIENSAVKILFKLDFN